MTIMLRRFTTILIGTFLLAACSNAPKAAEPKPTTTVPNAPVTTQPVPTTTIPSPTPTPVPNTAVPKGEGTKKTTKAVMPISGDYLQKLDGSGVGAGTYFYTGDVESVYAEQKAGYRAAGWEIIDPTVTPEHAIFFIRKGSSGFSVDIASCSRTVTDPQGNTSSVCSGKGVPAEATVRISYITVG